MKTFIKLLFLNLVVITSVFAIPFKPQTNEFIIGRGADAVDKTFTFNIGLGGSNPVMFVDDTTQLFEFTNGLSVTGNGTFTGNVSGVDGTFTGPVSGTAATFSGLTYGDATTGDNKITVDVGLGGSNPQIGWSNALQSLVFDNGTGEKKFGTGSGGGGDGGENLLANPSFEDTGSPILNWTQSGGTFTQEDYVNTTETNTKFARMVATGAAEFFESDLVTIPDYIGPGCMADFYYNQGDSAYDYQVLDAANDVKASGSVSDSTIFGKAPVLTFPCSTGQQFKLRIISTGAGTIDVDTAYLGSDKNVAPFIATNTDWVDEGPITIEATTSNPTKGGTAQDSMFSRRIGDSKEFRIEYEQTSAGANGNGEYYIVLNDTIDLAKFARTAGITSDVRGAVVGVCSVSNTNVQNTPTHDHGMMTIWDSTRLRCNVDKDGNDTQYWSSGIQQLGLTTVNFYAKFTVPILGLKSEEQFAYTPEAAEFFLDVSIGGANVDTPVSGGSPNEITNSGLDMVLNNGAARIPCSGTNSPTGLTCTTGSESLGVNFNVPRTGKYKACVAFGAETTVATTGFARLVQTGNSDQSILQTGRSLGKLSKSASNSGGSNSVYFCSIFDLSIGETTLRLFAETNNVVTIFADRNAGVFDRDINITVEMIGHNVSKPILVDPTNSVSTPGIQGAKHFSATISSSGVVSKEIGDFINGNCTNSGTGVFECDLVLGAFSTEYNCQITLKGNNNSGFYTINQDTLSEFDYDTFGSGGGASNREISLNCHGY